MNLLILDEPTNHLDIDSKEAREAALEEFDGTIIAVSHDRYFIEKLANRIIELKPDGYVDGDMFDYAVTRDGHAYTEFREFTDARRARLMQESAALTGAAPSAPAGSNKEQYLKNKQDAAEARKKANKIKRLTAEMESLEAELASVEEEMNGEAATDYKKIAELDKRKTEIEERLMEIYEELE
jgi:ATP-binding cassette subfamily F protein 3